MLHPREVGMCVSRKYLYPSHGRSLEISRKVGRGGEVLEKISSLGWVWIFSGTTHCCVVLHTSIHPKHNNNSLRLNKKIIAHV